MRNEDNIIKEVTKGLTDDQAKIVKDIADDYEKMFDVWRTEQTCRADRIEDLYNMTMFLATVEAMCRSMLREASAVKVLLEAQSYLPKSDGESE
jgi:hypothetical protein